MGWRRRMPKSPGGKQPVISPPHSQHLPLKPPRISHQSLNMPCAPSLLCRCIFVHDTLAASPFMMLPDPAPGDSPLRNYLQFNLTLFLLCFHSCVRISTMTLTSHPVMICSMPVSSISSLREGLAQWLANGHVQEMWSEWTKQSLQKGTKGYKKFKGEVTFGSRWFIRKFIIH